MAMALLGHFRLMNLFWIRLVLWAVVAALISRSSAPFALEDTVVTLFVMLAVLKQAPAEVAIWKRVCLTAGGSFQRDLFQSARKSSTCAPLLTVSL